MKKLLALLLVGALMMPMMANAGYVGVGTNYLYGTMSHTYPNTTDSIYAYGYAGSTVYFYAYTVVSGVGSSFYCTVAPSAANYAAAVEAKAHFNIGTYLYVIGTNGGACTYMYYQKSNRYVN